MKYFFAYLIAAFAAFSQLSAQDSLTVSTEIDSFRPPQYISDFDNFLLRNEPSKYNIKAATILDLSKSGYRVENISFGFEHRLYANMSLNISAQMRERRLPEYNGTKLISTRFERYEPSVSLETRFYQRPKRALLETRRVDNLSGLYLGMQLQSSWVFTNGDSKKASDQLVGAKAVFGFQEFASVINPSFYKNGNIKSNNWINGSIGIGAAYSTVKKTVVPLLEYQVIAGIAFRDSGKKKKPQLDDSWVCNVYRCEEVEKSQFRINLINLLGIDVQSGFSSNVELAYEQKIGNSPYSINFEVGGGFGSFKYKGPNEGSDRLLNAHATIEPRFYLTQYKANNLGQSSNNLSGIYLGLVGGYQNRNIRSTVVASPTFVNQIDFLFMGISLGYQQRVFKNFYHGYAAELGRKTDRNNLSGDFFNRYSNHFNISWKAGLAF
jgi:hypothetical protein